MNVNIHSFAFCDFVDVKHTVTTETDRTIQKTSVAFAFRVLKTFLYFDQN